MVVVDERTPTMQSLLVLGGATEADMRRYFNLVDSDQPLQPGVRYQVIQLMAVEIYAYLIPNGESALTPEEIPIPEALAISKPNRGKPHELSGRYASLYRRNVCMTLSQLESVDMCLYKGQLHVRDRSHTAHTWLSHLNSTVEHAPADVMLSIYRVFTGFAEQLPHVEPHEPPVYQGGALN